MSLALWLAWACTPDTTPQPDDSAAPTCEAGAEAGEFSVAVEAYPEGVFLSGWYDGAASWLVGGAPGGGSGFVARYDAEGLCTWESDLPAAVWWVHGTGPERWVAVGEDGLVLSYAGGTLERVDLPEPDDLFGVWVTDDRVWAIGGDAATGRHALWLRESGAWTRQVAGEGGVGFKLWGDRAVGDRVAWRWDGSAWVPVANDQRLLTVVGDGPGRWAVGGSLGPVVLEEREGAWEALDVTGLQQPLSGVWAGGGRLFVAGNFGTTAIHDGEAWTQPRPPLTAEHLHAAWGHCGEVLWAGGNLFANEGHHGTLVRWGPSADPIPTRGRCEGR